LLNIVGLRRETRESIKVIGIENVDEDKKIDKQKMHVHNLLKID